MQVNEMITDTNERRKKLSSHNRYIYGEMLVYLRTLRLKEKPLEATLSEVLDHLEEAEADGKKAEEIFGEDVPAFCDELVSELPKSSFKTDMMYGVFFSFGIMLFIIVSEFISFLFTGQEIHVSLLSTGIYVVVSSFAVIPLFWAVTRMTTFQQSFVKKHGPGFVFGAGIFLLALLNEWFLGDIFIISLQPVVAVIIIFLCVGAASVSLTIAKKVGRV